jgi:hypothetical protein
VIASNTSTYDTSLKAWGQGNGLRNDTSTDAARNANTIRFVYSTPEPPAPEPRRQAHTPWQPQLPRPAGRKPAAVSRGSFRGRR